MTGRRKTKQHIRTGWEHFSRQLAALLRKPIFLVLTIVGNLMVLVCASLFFLVESGSNPSVTNFGNALWWAFVTITSVGYGDVVPLTSLGRLIAVFLMFTGGALFLSFITLLSSAFVELEFHELKRSIKDLSVKLDNFADKKPDN